MEKKSYENPQINIIIVDNDQIITTSLEGEIWQDANITGINPFGA